MAPNNQSSLLWQVIGQWKLWIVAAVAVVLAALLSTQTGDMRSHVVFFGLIAVGSVLFAVRNVRQLRAMRVP